MFVNVLKRRSKSRLTHDVSTQFSDWKRDSDPNIPISMTGNQPPEVVINHDGNGHGGSNGNVCEVFVVDWRHGSQVSMSEIQGTFRV